MARSLRHAFALLALYWLALFIGTHLPTNAMPRVSGFDKLLHAGAYAGLAFLLAWARWGWGRALPTRLASLWLLAALYGVIDEGLQFFTPGRTPDLFDWIADVVGAAAGLGVYLLGKFLWTCWQASVAPPPSPLRGA